MNHLKSKQELTKFFQANKIEPLHIVSKDEGDKLIQSYIHKGNYFVVTHNKGDYSISLKISGRELIDYIN